MVQVDENPTETSMRSLGGAMRISGASEQHGQAGNAERKRSRDRSESRSKSRRGVGGALKGKQRAIR